MSAAAPAPFPFFREGSYFWDQLTEHCRKRLDAVNAVVVQNGLADHQCQFRVAGPELKIEKQTYPSTNIKLLIGFYSWGPMISLAITGNETPESEFFPEEWELPVSADLDGSTVAIFDEGRSFSARDLATYVTQSLRRSFPGVCLGC